MTAGKIAGGLNQLGEFPLKNSKHPRFEDPDPQFGQFMKRPDNR